MGHPSQRCDSSSGFTWATRRVGADVVISDTQISGKHCTLEIRDGTGILRDLGSINGIFVGNKQVKTATLEHLSEFRIGATTFMFTVTPMDDPERA
jgi:pSer/pThr/pTyr-binding forkhead associated (FHA) protein